MSDNGNSRPNGAASTEEPPAPRKSLREIAEDSYDEVIEASEEEPSQPPVDDGTQPRDALGRFAPKTTDAKPGEAEAAQQPPPSPDQTIDQSQQPHPAPQPGEAAQAPANWSAADREAFAKLAPEGQQFLLRRHSEMEGDYQRRVGATRQATEFAQSLAPIFGDPAISQSLQENNLNAYGAIREWASMHKRAISPDMRDRVVLWHEIGARMGLDPAAVYGQSRPGLQGQLSEQDLKDPAIAFFADHVSRTANEVQALRGQLHAMQQAEVQRTNAEALKVTKWGIDSYADEKDAQGKPLRPDFDTVLPQLIELFSVNPQRDMNDAYAQALWMNPQTRAKLIAAERSGAQQQISNERAKAAVRVNARGVTSPVGKPAPEAGAKPASLRDMLEQTADEIGFG